MPLTVLHGVPGPLKVEALVLIVIITVVPTPRVPSAQLIAPPVCVQLPCEVVRLVKVTEPGKVSVTLTVCATAGPLLVTCMVYVKLAFWFTGSGVAVFTMETSACDGEAANVKDMAALFAVFGSLAVGPMVAVLVIFVPGASELVACTTSGNVAEAPELSGPVQVTGSGTPTGGIVQLKPAGATNETNVVPVGITLV